MIQKRTKFAGIVLGLVAILVACGSSPGGGSGSSPVPTATLTASPASVTTGQDTALAFTSTNAETGSINNGVGPVGTNSQILLVPPLGTTTYIYTATGPGGSATAQATVTVSNALVPTVTLSATPASVFPGQPVTLTWTSTNATSVVIQPVPGGVQPVASGSGIVSPTQTTTYTAIATGNGQQVTATAKVTVGSPVNSFEGIVEPESAIGTADGNDVDPNGAVGTKQFMEYVNTQYQAFDKGTFAPVAQNGVSTPLPIETPWTENLVEECALSTIKKDAVINFDRLASRWVITAKSTDAAGSYYFCIAVSNTDDLSSASLAWYAYAFPLDSILGENAEGTPYFPDWPKLGTWPDAYYATMDVFDQDTETETDVGVVACALDRTNMLLGASQSSLNPMQCFKGPSSLLSNGVYLGHSLIPADVDGTTPPPSGRDEFMVSIENPINDGTTTTSNTINLWDFHVDWTTPANSTFTLATPTVTTYTPGCYLYVPDFPGITNCVQEPASAGSGQIIDSVGDRFMPRFAYRNFGTYESFLVSHAVQTGPGPTGNEPNDYQTGIRWYEFRDELSGTPTVYQSGTINPDNSLFRFLPSIAQDQMGNAAVGYSVSNAGTDPGIDFSYWSLTTGSVPAEVTILNGTAEEVTSAPPYYGQWGTYSSMTVDPTDNCTFWYVNEYWPTNSSWSTRIANFVVPGCQ